MEARRKPIYQPPAFRENRIEEQHALIAGRPLGLLIASGEDGLAADLIPFLLDPSRGDLGTLRAHFSRANPQIRRLPLVDECLVVFQDVDGYITPSWYETKRETGKVVPTWNYATVHVWGKPRLVEDEDWIRRQVGDLTSLHEGSRPDPWSVEDAPDDYVRAQIKGIVGLEIPISRIEGKWKVSQNRPEADRIGVVEGLRREGGEAMARLVEDRGR